MSLSEESEELLGKVRQALESRDHEQYRAQGAETQLDRWKQEALVRIGELERENERLRLALQDAERRVKALEQSAEGAALQFELQRTALAANKPHQDMVREVLHLLDAERQFAEDPLSTLRRLLAEASVCAASVHQSQDMLEALGSGRKHREDVQTGGFMVKACASGCVIGDIQGMHTGQCYDVAGQPLTPGVPA